MARHVIRPTRGLSIAMALAGVLLVAQAASATPTDTQVVLAIQNGATWLTRTENADGSWGANDDDKLLYTAETVRALRAADLLGPLYLRGVTWLENHSAPNNDLGARRFAALAPHGDTLQVEQTALTHSKAAAAPGLPLSGWGLTAAYRADPLDTALVMLALGANAPATFYGANLDAIQGLRDTIWDAASWTIGQPQSVLPFEGDLPTTIAVANTFRACSAAGIPSCVDIGILNSTDQQLGSYAWTNSSELALIASYFTPLKGAPPIPLSTIGTRLDSLLTRQSTTTGQTFGSWDNDALTTTTALHALASWLGLDRADAPVVVPISRAGLRDAVNRALGNPSMDVVTRGDLWRLSTLDLSYASTGADLSALAANATNLTTIDISGNACLLAIPNVDTVLHGLFPKLTTIIQYPVGDMSRDGAVNAYDQVLLLGTLQSRWFLLTQTARAGDLNLDGRLDARDLYWMERILLKRDVSQLCQ